MLRENFNVTQVSLEKESFVCRSNFVVATGAPMSGKTSSLSALGVPFQREVATTYIEAQKKAGRTIPDLIADYAGLTERLAEAKITQERSFSPSQEVLFDRGLPDHITYFRNAGFSDRSIAKLVEECRQIHYRAVLFFEKFPDDVARKILEQDSTRIEDLDARANIDAWLRSDYTALSYDLIEIPYMEQRGRIEFLRKVLKELGITTQSCGHSGAPQI